MRISSSTASTFAMPARKIAWLSARISLSMLSALQNLLRSHQAKRLRVPYKLIRVDHASHTLAFFAGSCGIGAHHAALALDHHILLPACDVRRERDLKFHRRAHFQRGVGADVNSGRAQV